MVWSYFLGYMNTCAGACKKYTQELKRQTQWNPRKILVIGVLIINWKWLRGKKSCEI